MLDVGRFHPRIELGCDGRAGGDGYRDAEDGGVRVVTGPVFGTPVP